ncbi:hypothetical protein [Natronococcus occultus]|uniref:Membrane-bound metal-dependent hydrolase (DUF457) n=1 Tax=Natronococcus occultus SP4 TaxID=694430 RepID=L0K0J1_9EURY|nr:hypothetical protein [Natronococcus occultus]AGB38080.1 hypothetical protein Natoc_2304 [Natronococcus occultus SP4]
MMATTHVFAGLAVVAPVAYAVPELATPLAVGAVLGGLLPDIDLVFEHRRTFHFPVIGAPAAVAAIGAALLVPSNATAAVAACFVAAWLHAASDALGDGPEFDPATGDGDRAVYDHVHDRWLRPRRWVRYDGAPEDGVLAVALAVPALVVFEGWIVSVVAAGVVISIGYVLVRRRLVARLPEWLE